MIRISRRSAILQIAAACTTACVASRTATPAVAGEPDTSALRAAARKAGILLSVFTGKNELYADPLASSTIANTYSMIAVGNDLKFSNRLRPAPDRFDFSIGDDDLAWAQRHKLLFRAHCLVWWNALPSWFSSYVTHANARQVMANHITTVVKHYAGSIYAWDVVNEAIYHDNRPDGLRIKPWLDLVGTDYIDLAFHTAHDADPNAYLVLNECYIEHNTDAEKVRRTAFLNLARRLRNSGVPVTHIGIQGHLRGATPLDKPGLTDFCKAIQDLGLGLMITEFDVDTINVPASEIQQTAAAKFGEFTSIVAPYVTSITFEASRDNVFFPKRPDGNSLYANLFDTSFRPNPAYASCVQGLSSAPARASAGRNARTSAASGLSTARPSAHSHKN